MEQSPKSVLCDVLALLIFLQIFTLSTVNLMRDALRLHGTSLPILEKTLMPLERQS